MGRMGQEHATISQVAEAAGVSMTTVSRYLNGKYEYMSDETRRRIAAVVDRLDYRPSRIARSLKTRVSRSVGCVMADVGSPFSSLLLKGVDGVCSKAGYQVLFADAADSPEKERAAIQELLASRVDGLIVNTTGGSDGFLAGLRRRGIPLVLADRRLAKDGVLDTVTAENTRASFACMRHLRGAGFAHVAFFTQEIGRISPRRERREAFLRATRELFGADGAGLVFETGAGSAEPYAALKELRARFAGERLAVLCVNGMTTLQTLQAVRRLGWHLDESFGVCGFDDWEWMELIPPGITAIAKDSRAIGARAAELLMRRIGGGGPPETVTLELESSLRVRGSTDPALAARFFGG